MTTHDPGPTADTSPNGSRFDRRNVLGRIATGLWVTGLAGITTGTASGHPDDELPNTIVVESRTKRLEYRVRVSGDIEFGDTAGDGDVLENGTVEGSIDASGAIDDYRFSGEVQAFEVIEGKAKVTVNGRMVDVPFRVSDGPIRSGITLKSLTDRLEYLITVDGEIAFGPTAGENDDLDGETVDGLIDGRGGVDDYRARATEIEFEILDGTAVLLLKRIHDQPTADDQPNTVTFVGQGPAVEYKFVVTGGVTKGDDVEDEATDIPADRVASNFVNGFLDEATDTYHYGGNIALLIESPVTVTVTFG